VRRYHVLADKSIPSATVKVRMCQVTIYEAGVQTHRIVSIIPPLAHQRITETFSTEIESKIP
jgi:hypothetical protein